MKDKKDNILLQITELTKTKPYGVVKFRSWLKTCINMWQIFNRLMWLQLFST